MSFFPGAKIGVLGLNGAGKSTLLRIMAGIDKDIEGEARPQPDIKIGYLPQEPQLNPEHTVRESIEEAVSEVVNALKRLDEVYALYADPDADFDKLAAEQGRLEEIIQAHDGHNLNVQLERAADALRLPIGTRKSLTSPVVSVVAWRCAACFWKNQTCCCSTNRPTTWMPNPWPGWNASCTTSKAPLWRLLTTVTSSITLQAGSLELDRGEGIPWEGNYSSWLERKNQRLAQEESFPQEAARRKSIEKELEWVRRELKAASRKVKHVWHALKS